MLNPQRTESPGKQNEVGQVYLCSTAQNASRVPVTENKKNFMVKK